MVWIDVMRCGTGGMVGGGDCGDGIVLIQSQIDRSVVGILTTRRLTLRPG